jgi:DNA helicase-2/ATP-dependent DNA helicase PcrA
MSTVVEYRPAEIARRLGRLPPTDQQAAIISAPLQPAVVIAGAGSGKTDTMAARVVWLVANGHVEPDRILGLTFTRKAAGELQHRIRARLKGLSHAFGQEQPLTSDPTVLTYAAYAGRLVDEHAILLGSEPGSRLLTEAARWQVADSVVRHYDGSFATEPGVVATVTDRLLNLAGQLADHLVDPRQVERLTERMIADLTALPLKPTARSREWPEAVQKLLDSLVRRRDLLPLVQAFDDAKRDESALDFADQMVLAARLAVLPAVAEVERSRYDVVLLDEYQDTGHAQIEMLWALFGDGRAVTAVGDPLQSIYGWRGASAGNIRRFANRFRISAGEPAPVYSLMTSWRNDRRILAAANEVAAPLRQPGELSLTERPDAPEGRVVATYTDTIEAEAAWLARQLRAEWDTRQDWTESQRTLAILVRKRSGIALIAQAVRDAGLPVEVVDLGGLLTLPEIADVRSVLQVLADHNSGGSLARLLTGARWRIGPADVVALHQRARALAAHTGLSVSQHARSAAEALGQDEANDGDDDERIEPSLVEALDDLGEPSRYSAEGFRRLAEFAGMLRRLRRRLDLPLPDLISEIERALGLDVEVAARPGSSQVGRANLDRFIDEAARFASERAGAGVSAFLGYLKAAEQEEYGLKPAMVEVQSDRVQVLTVHGAKGLEWDVVAVAGLVADGFPDAAKSHDWASTPALLPSPLRGDHRDLPTLSFDGCQHRGDAEDRIVLHKSELKQRHLLEERRLAYVAMTRSRRALYLSGAAWGTGSTVRKPSIFLTELRALAADGTVEIDGWYEPQPNETNPRDSSDNKASWPFDPLGSRRAAVEAGAALVRAARAGTLPTTADQGIAEQPPLAAVWQRDVDLLLAERAAEAGAEVIEVQLPDHLSVSDVVMLAADEATLARRLRRPLPQRPAKQARRGTAFHSWLEQRWAADTLLDVDELPGAVDEVIDDEALAALKESFEASAWADKTPIAVEVPFEMTFNQTVVRGRMDAVFSDGEGRYTVVDWKTGKPPVGDDATAKAVQLAIYRLAWAALHGIPEADIGLVAAAFYYVGADVTVSPANLLTADQIRKLINGRGATGAPNEAQESST